ncbi:NADH dehydrogenase [Geosmithia morbida]|uniref:NADH dehydrogenase n=1 Tax=Geosmithia morbida TaxID=1094350 RepID=A0A9P4YT51_9HYPO|nr:NADH dehydrogenase [Geosmithia morbida]KAF4121243.1 NADH dehydrogenase [Geosmithia morbida]
MPMLASSRVESRILPRLAQVPKCLAAHQAQARRVRWASTNGDKPQRERVVILGSGWAGYALGRTLSPKTSDRVIVSPRSHFVFTPLLAGTAVGTLEFRTAVEPVRRLGLSEFHQAWVNDIDFDRRVVRIQPNTRDDVTSRTGNAPTAVDDESQYEVPYDKLVVAVGCSSQTFNIEGVREHASFLRDVGDARAIRLRVLQAFEKAAIPTATEKRRKKLLHFAVVGGGPTGIEFSAELHDLVHEDIARLYPHLIPYVRITVYDIAPKVLPMFDRKLADYATETFSRQGIRIKTQHAMQRLRKEDDFLMMRFAQEPEEIPASVVVWSTGLTQNPLLKKLHEKHIGESGTTTLARDPRTGGIIVDRHLRVQIQDGPDGKNRRTLPDVYAIGDCSVIEDSRLPPTAQVANQQAIYLGKRLNKGDHDEVPFRFRNLGVMAYIGGWRAIHQSSADELAGRAAWVLWRTAYLTRSMSLRNKILVPVYWCINWLFGRDISRF